jgi:hypothetical protein
MQHLVIARVPGLPPAPTTTSLRAGLETLERLAALRHAGKVEGAGVFAGRMGMCFVVDAVDHVELHATIATLPTFLDAEWEVIPLVSLDDDIDMTRAALAHFDATE